MKYVSIGCNCVPSLLLKGLGKRDEAYPFDWAPNTLAIVIDCLLSGFKHYGQLGGGRMISGVNEELCRLQTKMAPKFSSTHINYYNNWFPHYASLSSAELERQLNRRSGRFMNLLRGDEDVTLIYANEHAIYLSDYLVNQPKYYKNLLTLEELVRDYRRNFRILGIFVNEAFEDTNHVKVHRVDWDREKIFKDGECHMPLVDAFRNLVFGLLRRVL